MLFLSPWGFGYIKDRDHVAGFRSHGFRSNAWNRLDEGKRWQVKYVQLVGILSLSDIARHSKKGEAQDGRREIEDAADAGGDQGVGDILGCLGRDGDNT